jgi:hypothetical protein
MNCCKTHNNIDIITDIMSNDNLINIVKNNIKEIAIDGKIELYNIQSIILIVIKYIENNYKYKNILDGKINYVFSKIQISYEMIVEILVEICINTLEDLDLIPEDEYDTFRFNIKGTIIILMYGRKCKPKRTSYDRLLFWRKKYDVNII